MSCKHNQRLCWNIRSPVSGVCSMQKASRGGGSASLGHPAFCHASSTFLAGSCWASGRLGRAGCDLSADSQGGRLAGELAGELAGGQAGGQASDLAPPTLSPLHLERDCVKYKVVNAQRCRILLACRRCQ